ncbi:MAG: hypothetical protein RL033_2937 [Pseudomonadota bacterium]|jgi:hypothetical protein
MEIYLDRRAIRQIRLAATDSIEEGDSESLREEVLEAFSEDQVEEIERRLDSGDFFEFLTDVLDEWGGDDADELLELLETQLAEAGIDVKTDARAGETNEEEEEEEDDEDDDEEDAEVDAEADDEDDAPADGDEEVDDTIIDDE